MDPPEQSAALRLVEHAVDGGERLDQAGRSLLPGGAQPGGRFGFVHGWMRDQVKTLIVAERAYSSAALVSGELRNTLKQFSYSGDSAASGAALVSGALETKLIVYQPARETASSAAGLVSGSLE